MCGCTAHGHTLWPALPPCHHGVRGVLPSNRTALTPLLVFPIPLLRYRVRAACAHTMACSLEASKFERGGRGFDYHCHYEHNMWDYVSLDAYLALKEETSFTGLETYVNNATRRGALTHFPIGRASSVAPVGEAGASGSHHRHHHSGSSGYE